MTDLPIPMSAPMVRAILREIEAPGTGKTQTRRALNPQPAEWKAQVIDITKPTFDEDEGGWGQWVTEWSPDTFAGRGEPDHEIWRPLKGLRYAVGDRLYVREHWRTLQKNDCLAPRHLADDRSKITYEADPENRNPLWAFGRFRQGMHMPRWASRLTLIVTEVRVERLHDCSEADAKAEGVTAIGAEEGPDPDERSFVWAYSQLWDQINGLGAWDANPWVAAYTFRPILGNIDQIGGDA